jgi:hypothetical protein
MNDILDTPILQLSETDFLDARAGAEGIISLGGPGSGKSTGSGDNIAIGSLKAGFGAVFFCAKGDEEQRILRLVDLVGRGHEARVFSPYSGEVFDPLFYESQRNPKWMDPERLIEVFSGIFSHDSHGGSGGDNKFWEQGVNRVIRNDSQLLHIAREPISIANIDRMLGSHPTFKGEEEHLEWQKSYLAEITNKIRTRPEQLTEAEWTNVEVAAEFCYRRWPELDERPRSSLHATWSNMADPVLFEPYRSLLSGAKCSMVPEEVIHDRAIHIINFPLLELGRPGRDISMLIRNCYQRAFLARKISECGNPVLMYTDECQYFLGPKDNFFQQTCRSNRVINVMLTQNILNMAEQLGETQVGPKTKAILGNFGTKIFHQQNETETCIYAADQIGKHYVFQENFNAGQAGAAFGGSRQLAYIVEPIEFTRLRKPDGNNPFAEAIVYQSGKTFNATRTEKNPEGTNYLRCFFPRV